MDNIVSKQQHTELRLKHAENLLRQYRNLTSGLNPDCDIPKDGGIMAELISLCEKTIDFVGVRRLD